MVEMTKRVQDRPEAGAPAAPTMFPIRSPGLPPLEVVTPIRPSEAIRLGILLAPRQSTAGFLDEAGGVCVIGTLNIGYGRDFNAPHDEIPVEVEVANICPATGRRRALCAGSLVSIPYHLNDDHRWTRERIADWLQGLGL